MNDITYNYYQQNSKEYFDSTIGTDVSSIYEHFCKYVPSGGRILDLGCGSGRDIRAFRDMGYDADGIDGSEKLCKLARTYTDAPIRCMDFATINDIAEYNAIWACASLLHIPYEEILPLFKKLMVALKDNGVIYASFKYGDYEGERDDRYYTDMTSDRFRTTIESIKGLSPVEEWTSEENRNSTIIKWYNTILRKD